MENTLWQNTVLSSGKILGMVIYNGSETRMNMNSKEPRNKYGLTDRELNVMIIQLFVMMTVVSTLIFAMAGSNMITLGWEGLFLWFRYFLLMNNIIPISLRVNQDFSKWLYCIKIDQDVEIPGTCANNKQIPEELGRI